MKKILFYTAVVIVTAGIIWIANINRIRQGEQVYKVSTDIVSSSRTIDTSIKVSGRVVAKETNVKHVKLPFGGIIKDIMIEENKYVEKGTPLLIIQQFSDSEFKTRYDFLTEEINDLEIELLKAQYDLEVRYWSNLEDIKFTYEKLLNDLTINKKELELLEKQKEILSIYEYETKFAQLSEEQKQIEHNLNMTKIELDFQQDIGLKNVKHTYDKFCRNLNNKKKELLILEQRQNYIVNAEVNGFVVFNKVLFIGEVISPYETVFRLINLDDLDNILVQAELVDFEYNRVNVGDRATIYLNNLINESIEGKILQKPLIAQVIDQATYYNINISLESTDIKGDLILNMPVDVVIESKMSIPEILSGEKQEELYYTIPITAVVNRNNRNAVFLYEKEKSGRYYFAKLVYIDIVFSDNEKVIVRSKDINQDSILITTGNYILHGGERVILEHESKSGTLDLNLF